MPGDAPGHAASYSSPSTHDAQLLWAARPLRARLAVLRRARHLLARRTAELCAAIPTTLARNPADTLITELLPLLDACRFLEREATNVLRTRHLGRRGLPWWLGTLSSSIERVPLGQILVIAPANYPLFLPGVQTLQALAAGNAVVWKPGAGGRSVAEIVAATLCEAGLPIDLLTVTDDTPEAAREAIAGHITGAPPDKVILTGSFDTGRDVLHLLAESAIPCVAELSGCDSVIALPSADLDRLAAALAFGMRLNGSATCMAPRRLFLLNFTQARRDTLFDLLRTAFSQIPPIPAQPQTAQRLDTLLRAAHHEGATVFGGLLPSGTGQHIAPTLVTNATPHLALTQADLFAPVLSVLEVPDHEALLAADAACPYALTSAIFGDERDARTLVPHLHARTILINDLIVPTADPRLPFTGRGRSGFGSTRGAEGLLEMTSPRSTVLRRGSTARQYQPTGPAHIPFFEGMIRFSHAATWKQRLDGLRKFVAAARRLR